MTTHWHVRWDQNRTAWDLNGSHPLTISLCNFVLGKNTDSMKGKWLIPGCGRAHDCVALFEMGATKVVAKDIVPKAIDEAKKIYGNLQNLSLECGSIFDVLSTEKDSFDGVFDRAMLCALDGEERQKYISSITSLVKVGGFFVSIPFCETSNPLSGPPFQISEADLCRAFGSPWEILMLEQVVSSACDQKILKEWKFIARKKGI